jgi:asparagine synthase (glutamine-hydrolysing)
LRSTVIAFPVSGTAADELFTGYFDHHPAYLAEVPDADLHARSPARQEHVRPIVLQSLPERSGSVRQDLSFAPHLSERR